MTVRLRKHSWWVWIGIEIAFVSLLFIALPAKASPIWECKSEGGWSQSPIGDFTEIPKTDNTDTTMRNNGERTTLKLLEKKNGTNKKNGKQNLRLVFML